MSAKHNGQKVKIATSKWPDPQQDNSLLKLEAEYRYWGDTLRYTEKRGLVLDVGRYYKNVFTLAPYLCITEKEIDLAVSLFEGALQKGIILTS